MKPETRDRLLADIDNATAKLTQFSSIEQALSWASDFSGRVHRKLEQMRTREQISAMLDAEPEPSLSSIEMFESIVHFVPYLLNRLVKKVATGAIKGLPEAPSGPRPILTAEQEREACKFIGDFVVRGVPLSIAQKRAAMRWNISFRSIERTWGRRAALHQPASTIEEADTALTEWWNSQ